MSDTPNYYSLKVVLRDDTNMVYIMLSAVFDPIDVKAVKYECVACATPSSLLPVRSTFQDFANRTQRVIYKGEQLKNITKSLQEGLKTTLSSESVLQEILHYIDHNLVDRLKFIFTQLHNRVAGLSNPSIELHYDVIEPSALTKTTIDEDEIARAEAAMTGSLPVSAALIIPIDKKIIQFRFQLSPVNGTRLTDIKAGDTVFIRLFPGDAVTDSIISSLDLKDEAGLIKQIPAKIVNIANSKNNSEVVIKINEQIYGKIVEEENSVKIKTFDSTAGRIPVLTSAASVTAASKPSASTEKDSSDISHLMPFIIIFALVAISLLAFFFFV